jgi:NAD(P)-dependent dehydrogenase (short-subunit alcohol dehydrogenase family)
MAFLSKGCVAVITGSSSGIGLAIAKGCAQRGMRVVLADVDEAGLIAAASAVSALCAGGADDVLAVVTDVSQIKSVEELKAKTYEKFGKTDLLVSWTIGCTVVRQCQLPNDVPFSCIPDLS